MRRTGAGFTLIEVLVALMVVALGLAALLTAVSSAARASGSLRDKTLAQWIALNRIAEVRLTVNKIAPGNDTAQLEFGGRTWHYDTRYFDTSIPTMKRITVRVWAGDSKSTGNPVAEATGFLSQAIAQAGGSNAVDWTQGSTMIPSTTGGASTTTTGTSSSTTTNTSSTLTGGTGSAPSTTP